MKRNFGFPRDRQPGMKDGDQDFPGEDFTMVALVGIGLAVCLTIALWVMLVPR